MADGYRFDILEKRAERKAHLDDIGVATLPDQPGKRGYSAAESRMHFKAPVDYLFSLLCGCMEEVGSEFDGYAPLSGADFTGDVTIGGSLSVSGGIACDGSSVLFEKDISELRATVAKHENNLYAYISHSDEEGALVATEIIKGVSPDKRDDGDALATTEWTNDAIAAEASVREAKDDDLEASIEALRKDFDDLKSVVYGIHSLTYNSYEFPYLTSSIIPDEVDGRKTVGGSYAIADWVGGNSVAFNQLAVIIQPQSQTLRGITYTNNGDGFLSISGTSEKDENKTIGNFKTIQGHKYLAISNFISGSPSVSTYWIKWGSVANGRDIGKGLLFTASSSNDTTYLIFTIETSGISVDCKVSFNIFDLTLMGLDNITSVDEFKALFPNDYYPYNTGEIKSTIVTKIESWGYNLFDGDLEIGAIDRGTGQDIANSNSLRSKNYIPVVAGKTYTLETNLSASQFTEGYIFEYDKDKNYIGYQVFNRPVSGTANQKTLSNDTRFVRLRYYGATNLGGVIPANETCFHITGSRTGYAPYVGKLGQIDIPNAPLKLNGVNDIHDTLTFEEQSDGSYNAILTGNIGYYTFTGNENFVDWAGGGKSLSILLSNAIGKSSTEIANILWVLGASTNTDKIGASAEYTISMNSKGRLYIATTKTSAELASTLQGKIIYYELATPTTEVIATGLTFEQVSFLIEKGGAIEAVYGEVPPTASIDFMTKGE